VALLCLRLAGVRNLADAEIPFDPRCTLVLGPNGAGKSGLLEAVALLGNLRSHRGAGWRQVVRHGRSRLRIEGEVGEGDGRRRSLAVAVDVAEGTRRLELDGAEVPLGRYLRLFPVAVLTGDGASLVRGSPEGRRALLDRLAFALEPSALAALRRYRHLLRQRNAALQAGQRKALEVWEEGLAAAAARVVALRRRALAALAAAWEGVAGDLLEGAVRDLELAYREEAEIAGAADEQGVAAGYRARYAGARERELALGFTLSGPHRHDLVLRLGGRPAREVLSAGQAKLVAAALRLAALEAAEAAGGAAARTVLLDDADSELDGRALERLLGRAGRGRQVVAASASGTRLGAACPGAARVWLRDGSALRSLPVENGYDEPVHG